jgi:lysophospholipase L1-like esterase
VNLTHLPLIAIIAIFLTACVSESDSKQTPANSSVAATETSTESTSNPVDTQTTEEEAPPIVITPATAPEPDTAPEESTESEVEEAPAAQVEILPWLRVPMHYEVLLGRSQIWGEAEGTVSLNLAGAALAGSSTIELNSTNNLLPLQLISYYGSDGEYYSAQIQSIEDKQVLLTTPLKQNVSAGPNAWNFYDNGSHPNIRGYNVIADFAVRFLGKEELNEGVHVLLGDSWFSDSTIFERLKNHLPAASMINKGIGGNTSTDLLARFDEDVLPHNPSFVWIMSGTNDYWQDVTAETYKANIDTLAGKIKALNAVPIIFDSSVGPLNFGTDAITELSHAYVTAIDELLTEN